jgi:hypothetical protein
VRHLRISPKQREQITHIEAPGCIVNITVRLREDSSGREVTGVEVIPDPGCDMPDLGHKQRRGGSFYMRVRHPEED